MAVDIDFGVIAAAIATRFAAANITPPDGYDNVALSTHRLPNAITTTPVALVYPPEFDSSFGVGGKVATNLIFPVRFYIGQTSDMPRTMDAVYAWQPVLIGQLEGDYDLGLSGRGVTHAVIAGGNFGTGGYAEQEYAVLEFQVGVHHESSYNPTT